MGEAAIQDGAATASMRATPKRCIAHRRLAHVQALGRAADALQLEHRIQCDQQIEIEFVEAHGPG